MGNQAAVRSAQTASTGNRHATHGKLADLQFAAAVLTVMSSPSTFDTRASLQWPSLTAVVLLVADVAAWNASTDTPTPSVNLHLWALSSPIAKSFLLASSLTRAGSLW